VVENWLILNWMIMRKRLAIVGVRKLKKGDYISFSPFMEDAVSSEGKMVKQSALLLLSST
jgi:hypothetical protein